jgi:hypothetical protein
MISGPSDKATNVPPPDKAGNKKAALRRLS